MNPWFAYKNEQRTLPIELQPKFERQMVAFDRGKWFQLHVEHAVSLLSTWNVSILYLGGNKVSPIYQHIAHVDFPALKNLVLWGNQIDSIELLKDGKFPSLSQIQLQANKIMRIGGIRKAYWKNMKKINLNDNCILDMNVLTGMFLPVLVCMDVGGGDSCQSEDLSWLLEMQTAKLQTVCRYDLSKVISQNGLKQQKTLTSIVSKKFHQMRMLVLSTN